MQTHSHVTANDDLLSAARNLIERYKPDPVPPCRVCGGPLSIQSSGRSGVSYACSGNYLNEEGLIRYHEGRRPADEHYMASRWEQFQSDDEDVLHFVNAVTELLERQAAEPHSTLGWLKVPEEYSLEFLKSINSDNQVLAYENGRYYNAWMEFEPSEGGWLWTDDADSEPNPSHYRFLKEVELNPPGKDAANAASIIRGEETTPEAMARRLFDGSAPMADGGKDRMTAAEEVLAWLLIEKIGVPDDIAYTPDQAQDIIAARLTNDAASAKAKAEEEDRPDNDPLPGAAGLSALTIGGTRFNNDGTYEFVGEIGETSQRAALERRISKLEDELHDALQAPWPEWATSILETLQKHGYDPKEADGSVDLAEAFKEYLAGVAQEDELFRTKLAEKDAEITRLSSLVTPEARRLVEVRLVDTEHGKRIHPDDVEKFGLKADYPYEGEALPVGRFRIAVDPSPQTVADQMHEALVEIRDAILRANPEVLTDTLWMPEDVLKGATVVDRIDMALSLSPGKQG